jgi:hypothetical protein
MIPEIEGGEGIPKFLLASHAAESSCNNGIDVYFDEKSTDRSPSGLYAKKAP